MTEEEEARGAEIKYSMSQALANLLRVMRGAGNPMRVIGDIERIAGETNSASDTSHGRTIAARALANGAGAWDEHYIERLNKIFDDGGTDGRPYSMISTEHSLCKAALRMMAAELDRNGMEAAKASNDMWRHIGDYNQFAREETSKAEMAEIEELTKLHRSAMAEDRRADKHNRKALAAANDNTECYVYFVTDGEAIKIGKAINPKSRLGGLQTSHHKPLRILHLMPGDEALEKRLHGKFHKLRIRGEWFRDHTEIREFIARDSVTQSRAAANDNASTQQNAA